MSHLSKVPVKITNKEAMEKAAKLLDWAMKVENFTNSYSRESVKNATVFRDNKNKIKYVVSPDGTPVVDEYYMKKDYYRFNQEYTAAVLKQTAMFQGAQFQNLGLDRQGNMIIELSLM